MDACSIPPALCTSGADRRGQRLYRLGRAWVLAKTEVGTQRLQTVLYALCECLRYIAVLVAPSCPKRPRRLSQSGWQTTR